MEVFSIVFFFLFCFSQSPNWRNHRFFLVLLNYNQKNLPNFTITNICIIKKNRIQKLWSKITSSIEYYIKKHIHILGMFKMTWLISILLNTVFSKKNTTIIQNAKYKHYIVHCWFFLKFCFKRLWLAQWRRWRCLESMGRRIRNRTRKNEDSNSLMVDIALVLYIPSIFADEPTITRYEE